MLDHVQAQLTCGLEQLVDHLAVGAALQPFQMNEARRSLPCVSSNRSSSIRVSLRSRSATLGRAPSIRTEAFCG
jgi:hypothetical protein